jgi:thiol-disulfide isomerase/thioredoxin
VTTIRGFGKLVALVVSGILSATFVASCSSDNKMEFKRQGTAGTEQVSAAATAQISGRKAPGFALLDMAGKSVNFSQYDGKVVLVDFWATWCPPCRRSIPDLSELHGKYGDRGFEVVGISLDQAGADKVALFAAQMKIPYTVVMGNMQVAADWNIGSAIPIAFLVDRQGEIVDRFVGYQDKSVLEEKIQKFL